MSKFKIIPASTDEPNVDALACAFADVLKEWLTADEMNKVVARNLASNDNTCASHDFCDANMAMAEAFTKVMGREYIFFDDDKPETEQQNSDDTDLTNKAWSLAKANRFYTN